MVQRARNYKVMGRTPTIADPPHRSDDITPYDEAHFAIHLGLLDAKAERAPDAEICRLIFSLDLDRDPERAGRILRDHLHPRGMDDSAWLSGSVAARSVIASQSAQARDCVSAIHGILVHKSMNVIALDAQAVE